jgi:hypothetical protein
MKRIDNDILLNPQKDTCIIAAVGQDSLHREWIQNKPDFDLHLIVYDQSYAEYKSDTEFIVQSKGYKLQLIYDYLAANEKILVHYNYFYFPDDDISINTKNVHRLFSYMREYDLAIAQPALTKSYYSHTHTIKRNNSKLRYTNFVEAMQPCFSKEALDKTLFTFNDTERRWGWGADYHWGRLVNYKKYNMAIIDDILSRHTRPVQSEHFNEMNNYLTKYNLSQEIVATSPVKK